MNRAIILNRHPRGKVLESDFKLAERPIEACGQVFRTKNLWISLDAGFRHWMAEGAGDNYLPGMQIGDPVQGVVIGEVVESNNSEYPVGSIVNARTAWEETSVLDGTDLCTKLSPAEGVPLHLYMSTLGLTGMTAWVGMHRVGKLKSDDTVVISAAGGAVGSGSRSVSKQLAAGYWSYQRRDKADWLESEVGYDRAIDREINDLGASLSNCSKV